MKPKRVLLAAPRSFCAGVVRAIDTVEQILATASNPIYVRHEIIHNRQVVSELERKGAVFVDEVDQVPEGATVVFSAHGVAQEVYTEAAQRGLPVVDATCPLVTKVHREAVRYAESGYTILLVGHDGHEEIRGTLGWASGSAILVSSVDEAAVTEVPDTEKLVWLSQTTLAVSEVMDIVTVLRSRFPMLEDPPSDDICFATQNRQNAVKEIANQCDLLLVVGSANSSNTVRLVEVGLSFGISRAYRVDHAEEIRTEWIDNVRTIGLTAGASAPESAVAEVLRHLKNNGFSAVEEITVAAEPKKFALPHSLRKQH
ncbi:4-hydroxy-3-methylbut-2-enyl diphosphate reductase [Actinokineospora iranica]|uniref:4-hydroxy-3-methylbut-2-enyl diphosphate reductase n=1 Tax=Actinokineospora iranica TaxID=1271860 RepID=A0A1G6VWJ5_9PSEU|nr:4-hydroxy-3-methylbut-2-enyl diphosphate reductase [Actinokineospora iranica]SDD57186.1 4-hydroxy-3-methylbut-2-enyl diphosphate reductase [Actinokineospora iranica]